jgi:hypothetical protein
MLARLLCVALVLALFSFTTLLAVAQPPDAGDAGVPLPRLNEVAAENLSVLSQWNEPSSFVLVQDDYAYVASTSAVTILNAAHPFSLTSISRILLPVEGSTVVGMAWANQHLYIRSFACDAPGSPICQNRIQVVNLSNPAAPTEVTVFQLSTPSPFYSQKEGLAVLGNTLLVPDGPVLRMWDISTPAAITEMNTFGYEGSAITAVAAQRATAYTIVAAPSGYTLWALDLSDPRNPDELGYLTIPDSASARGLSVVEGRAYVIEPQRATGGGGVRVVDVSDAGAPTLLAFYPAPGDIYSVAAHKDRAYITYADGSAPLNARLQVLDVSNPAAPVPVGSLGAGQHVAISEDSLWVAGGEAGLALLREGAIIAGRVTNAAGSPLPGVTIAASSILSATTDASGFYTFTGVLSGTYTVTPTFENIAFVPFTRAVTVFPSATEQNFTILPPPISATLEPGTATELVLTGTHGLTSTLLFPADAVNRTTPIVLTPTLTSNLPDSILGYVWELAAYEEERLLSGFTFATPVSVTLSYSDTDVQDVADEEALMLWWQVRGSWRDAHQTCAASSLSRKVEENTVTLPLCRTGRFAFFTRTHQQYLPLLSRP